MAKFGEQRTFTGSQRRKLDFVQLIYRKSDDRNTNLVGLNVKWVKQKLYTTSVRNEQRVFEFFFPKKSSNVYNVEIQVDDKETEIIRINWNIDYYRREPSNI